MSNALVLASLDNSDSSPGSVSSSIVRRDSAPTSGAAVAGEDASFVYGDSTPFPFDYNYIDAIRDTVACAVDLLKTQHALIRGRAREAEVQRRQHLERTRLLAVAEAVRHALGGHDDVSAAVARVAMRIAADARAAVDVEIQSQEAHAQSELASIRDAILEARQRGVHAIERLLARHDVPGTRVGFRLVAKDLGYGGEALITTPYGVHAVFELAIPPADAWSKRRRVAEILPGTLIEVPREAGWFAKKTRMERISLDKMFVLAASADGEQGMLIVGKTPNPGEGYEFAINAQSDPPRVVLAALGPDGREVEGDTFELGVADRERIISLWRTVRTNLGDVVKRRKAMTECLLDDRLLESEEPHVLGRRLVESIAPIVTEIARRSGAVGELVLRRNVRSGRRDEVYLTKAELLEMVMTLAPPLRVVFDPLDLANGPRSPRAPSPSLASYEEVSGDIVA